MYNFVIFSTPADYYYIAYYDLLGLPNVRYIRNLHKTGNSLINTMYRAHFYYKNVWQKYNPFKGIFNSFLFENDFGNKNPICFIFNERMLYLDNFGFTDYLKNTYENSKLVCYLQDQVETIKNIKIRKIINKFDLTITYDQIQAEKLGIFYYPTPYSYYKIKKKNNIGPHDIFFAGRAKNRLSEIISIYEKLKQEGFSCDFYLSDVDPGNQIYANEIHYNKILPYEEYLEHVFSSRCLLEIMQKDATGFTYRTWEAIMYDKLLLSNNASIKQAPFYEKRYINIYDELKGIDLSFIKNINEKIDYKYKDKLSPKFLLEFIDAKLKSEIWKHKFYNSPKNRIVS